MFGEVLNQDERPRAGRATAGPRDDTTSVSIRSSDCQQGAAWVPDNNRETRTGRRCRTVHISYNKRVENRRENQHAGEALSLLLRMSVPGSAVKQLSKKLISPVCFQHVLLQHSVRVEEGTIQRNSVAHDVQVRVALFVRTSVGSPAPTFIQ